MPDDASLLLALLDLAPEPDRALRDAFTEVRDKLRLLVGPSRERGG